MRFGLHICASLKKNSTGLGGVSEKSIWAVELLFVNKINGVTHCLDLEGESDLGCSGGSGGSSGLVRMAVERLAQLR